MGLRRRTPENLELYRVMQRFQGPCSGFNGGRFERPLHGRMLTPATSQILKSCRKPLGFQPPPIPMLHETLDPSLYLSQYVGFSEKVVCMAFGILVICGGYKDMKRGSALGIV